MAKKKNLVWLWISLVILIGYCYIDENMNYTYGEIHLEGTNGKTIFMIDGITGTPKPYYDMAKYFNELGYSVEVPLMLNHGGKLSSIKDTSISDIREDLKNKINDIDGEVTLLGTCSGALLIYDLSNELNKPAILINPPIDPSINIWPYISWMPYIYRFDIGLLKDNTQLSKVPRYNKYPVSLNIKINNYVATLDLNTNQNILIFQSDNDIRAHGSNKITGANVRLIQLHNSGHLAYLDVQKQIVYDEIENFMEEN